MNVFQSCGRSFRAKGDHSLSSFFQRARIFFARSMTEIDEPSPVASFGLGLTKKPSGLPLVSTEADFKSATGMEVIAMVWVAAMES